MLYLLILMITLSFSVAMAGEQKIIATVGDSVITESDLEMGLDRYMPRGGFHGRSTDDRRKAFREKALNDLIDRELLYHEARERGIKVSRDYIDGVIKENIKRYGSKKRLEDAIKKMGLDMAGLRKKIEKTEMVNLLLNDIARDTTPSEEDIKTFYEKNLRRYKRPEAVHLYHILIKVDPSSTEDEVRKKESLARDVREKIESGMDFEKAAYQYSDDTFRVKGGDLGLIHRGQLDPKELEDAAFSLKEGELSQTIRTIHGFHIMKAGERRSEETLSYEDVKDRIKRELHEERFNETKEALINSLKKKYHIKILESEHSKGS